MMLMYPTQLHLYMLSPAERVALRGGLVGDHALGRGALGRRLVLSAAVGRQQKADQADNTREPPHAPPPSARDSPQALQNFACSRLSWPQL